MSKKDMKMQFDRLMNYRDWTYSIVDNLLWAADSARISAVQKQLDQALLNITPGDFARWISSDVLHARQSLEHYQHAVNAVQLFRLSGSVRHWHEELRNSLELLDEERECSLLYCGPGPVDDREMRADDFVSLLRRFGCAPTIVDTVMGSLREAAMQPGKGLKPLLNDSVATVFQEVFEQAQQDPTIRSNSRLGGAQFNMGRAARFCGLPGDVHWLYHPPQVAAHESDSLGIRRLKLDNNGAELKGFAERVPGDPYRTSFVLTLSAGMEIADGLSAASVHDSDRRASLAVHFPR